MAVKNREIQYLSSIIQWHRKKSGITQKELADLAGVGKTTVFDVEKGKKTVHFDNIMKLLQVLNIKVILRGPLGKEWEVADEES